MKLDQIEFDSVNVNNILIGYKFESWSIEGSYNISKTQNKYYGGDQKIDMYRMLSVYRSKEKFYYKVKLGISNERYKLYNNTETLFLNHTHIGLERGIGVGYRHGKFNVELEYSWLGGSLEVFGVGIRYHFN